MSLSPIYVHFPLFCGTETVDRGERVKPNRDLVLLERDVSFHSSSEGSLEVLSTSLDVRNDVFLGRQEGPGLGSYPSTVFSGVPTY